MTESWSVHGLWCAFFREICAKIMIQIRRENESLMSLYQVTHHARTQSGSCDFSSITFWVQQHSFWHFPPWIMKLILGESAGSHKSNLREHKRVVICEIVSNCLNRPFNTEWIAISCYLGCSCSIEKLLLSLFRTPPWCKQVPILGHEFESLK